MRFILYNRSINHTYAFFVIGYGRSKQKIMKTRVIKIANIVAAVLIIASLVLTFMPYWHYVGTEQVVNDEGKKVKVEVQKDASINGYLWMIDDHKELTKIFDKVAKPVYEEEYKVEKAEIEKIADEAERSKQLKDLKKKTALDTNELISTALLMLVIGVVGLIFFIRNFDSLVASALSVAYGLVAITGFLGNDLGGTIFRMGNTWNSYMFQVIVGGVIAVIGAVAFVLGVPALLKKLRRGY